MQRLLRWLWRSWLRVPLYYSMQKFGCSIPGRDRPQWLKEVTALLSHHSVNVTGPRKRPYKWISSVIVGVSW